MNVTEQSSRVFYLVFSVVASEPHLSKVQQEHLLQVLKCSS